MDYEITRPCDNCPFRNNGKGVKLMRERIEQISQGMLNSQGITFACHKTTDGGTTEGTKHCAGALIYALKHGTMTQMMRIGERLRMFNPAALAEQADEVWDSEDEWVENGTIER